MPLNPRVRAVPRVNTTTEHRPRCAAGGGALRLSSCGVASVAGGIAALSQKQLFQPWRQAIGRGLSRALGREHIGQQEGGERHEIRPGHVVRIPPGVRHWHGATASNGMTHIAIQAYPFGFVQSHYEVAPAT